VNDAERRKELADFLRTRRDRLSPTDVGLPPGVRRKTVGLRREEVAQLASVGVTWYTWLEQGRDIHVSSEILESLAQVLLLNADEKAHLFSLANHPLKPSSYMQQEMVSPLLQRFLDQLGPSPAYITGRRWDLLAWNQAACQVIGDFSEHPPCPILQKKSMISSAVSRSKYDGALSIARKSYTPGKRITIHYFSFSACVSYCC